VGRKLSVTPEDLVKNNKNEKKLKVTDSRSVN
jgi:hypothetical protein